MKKSKLLTTLLSTTATTGLILSVTSCGCTNEDSTIKESTQFEKEQSTDKQARYIFILDKETYEKKDISIDLQGEGSDKFVVSYFVSGNMLIVDVKPIELPLDIQETYTFNLKVKVGEHTKEFSNLIIHVLPQPEVPTINEHLKYKYHEDTQSYYAYCDLAEEEKATWDVRMLYFESTYNDGVNGEHPVTGVEQAGFRNCTSIQKLIIPESITDLGNMAFTCLIETKNSYLSSGQITKIKFVGTSQLKTIGIGCFQGQNKLVDVTIPKSVLNLNVGCFYCMDYLNGKETSCGSLQNINFENDSQLKVIGTSAFRGQYQIKSIDIPDSVQTIGTCAFACEDVQYEYGEYYTSTYKCVGSLEKVNFGKNSQLKNIDYAAFRSQKCLSTFNLPNSVQQIDHEAFFCCDFTFYEENNSFVYTPCGSISNFNIDISNSSLQTIGTQAFWGQKELTSINIPSNCKEIALWDYTDTMASNPFALCPNLKTFNVSSSNDCVWSSTDKTMLFAYSDIENKQNKTLVSYPTAKGDVDLSGLNDLEWTGPNLFSYNDDITSVKLTNENTTLIRFSSFISCSNLSDLYIGKSINYIDSEVFDHSTKLVNFHVDSQNTNFKSLMNGDKKSLLLFNENSKWGLHAYPSASGDIDLTDTSYDEINQINSYCFNYSSITSFKTNENTSRFTNYAFNWCKKLKTMDANKATGFSHNCFSHCNIDTIKVASDNEEYEVRNEDKILVNKYSKELILYLSSNGKDVDFANTSYLQDINNIAANTFSCYYLDKINLISLGNLKSLDYLAFSNLAFENSKITIPTSITTIDAYVFANITGVQNIEFTDKTGWQINGEDINVDDSAANAQNLINGEWWNRVLTKTSI